MLRLGLPDILHSDQGREFVNGIGKFILTDLGFKFIQGRGYHPQSQGSVERTNKFLAKKLGSLMKLSDSNDWAALLPIAEAQVNIHLSRATNTSPHEFVFGEKLFAKGC